MRHLNHSIIKRGVDRFISYDNKLGFMVKVCPQCGSADITIPPAGLDLKMAVPDYCRKCKNRGIFPEVDDPEIFKKEMLESRKDSDS
jgi:hypothetical protein